jgi:tetratricopeptide (TPR) repeat protein
VTEAYDILRQLAGANHASGIIDWALPWLDAGQLPDQQRAEAVFLYFASAHYRFGPRKDIPPESVELVKRWLPHVRREMAGKPHNDMSYTAYVIALRQAGEMDEAVRVCEARHRAAPTYESAVSLAATFREAKRFDEWFVAEQEVLRISPDDIPTRLDLGDCFWEEQGNLAEAEKWYADALRIEPENAWAKPSLLAVRYFRTRETRWRDELEDHADAQPDDQRAEVCLGRVTPFFAEFVYPGDGSINNISGVADKIEKAMAEGNNEPVTGRIKSATTGLDVPSCRRSIDRQLELWGGRITLEREILGMQSPDPREPRVPVRHRLWVYDGTTPRPAVQPPPADVAQAVGRLAAAPYDLGTWCDYGAQIGGQLGERGIPVLLGVMAFPPDPPAGWRTWEWTPRVQLAAALGITGTSPAALEVLTDLANGPLDWTTAAAVVTLTAVARFRQNLAPRVRQLLTDLHRDLPRPGSDYYENVILNCHLRLPGLPPEERAALRAQRAEMERRVRKPTSEAEMAAGVFLARPVPEGAGDFPLIRQLIEAYMIPGGRDIPGFATTLDSVLNLAESFANAAEGDAKAYLDEQNRVLRLIQAQAAAAATT